MYAKYYVQRKLSMGFYHQPRWCQYSANLTRDLTAPKPRLELVQSTQPTNYHYILLLFIIDLSIFIYFAHKSISSTGAGAAWENLALEASSRGLVTHGMQGFDYGKARNHLEVPDNFDVMVMIAIGKKGPKNNLPPQLQEREYPTNRKPPEIVMEGQFRK
jgi:nitroreductase